MALISYAERQQHWGWMREFIDREVIYRVDDAHPPIPNKLLTGTYIWQFYLRRATFNPDFAYKLGVLFWDSFLDTYKQQPFQVCACNPSGPPIGSTILSIAKYANVPLNLFLARREPKAFGMDNWFEGRVDPRLPVLIVDDVAASADHMRKAAARIQVKLGLQLHRNYFAIVNKVGRSVSKEAQHTENLLDNELVALFTLNNFAKTVKEFKDRYGCAPQWTGIVQ